jgi:hypothetical protein
MASMESVSYRFYNAQEHPDDQQVHVRSTNWHKIFPPLADFGRSSFARQKALQPLQIARAEGLNHPVNRKQIASIPHADLDHSRVLASPREWRYVKVAGESGIEMVRP